MKIRRIIDEQPITVPELRKILQVIESERRDREKDMSYELRRSIELINHISTGTVERSSELVLRLAEIENVTPIVAYRIADLLPKSREEVRAIFGKDRFAHTTEEIDSIIDLAIEYSE
ncbi:MAG: RNA polymerase Rpb4 family protein [Methanomicrobiales archaeon]|jgi:DNA-directed RNA polymerase subunit F|nr:RNA polymerase Rpb4 family protein [Methanomicrobiales archaeon]